MIVISRKRLIELISYNRKMIITLVNIWQIKKWFYSYNYYKRWMLIEVREGHHDKLRVKEQNLIFMFLWYR
jgi:hypothetical protein